MNYKNNSLQYSQLGIIFFLVSLCACSFSSKTSRRLYNDAASKKYDIVVVPGIPLEDTLMWSPVMKARVCWAKFLYDKGIVKNIMFSGAAVHTAYYEAEVMAMYAEAIGVPGEHIYTETMAEHSTENIYYSYKKSKKLGFNTIALASDPFQSKQLRSFAYLRLSHSIGIIPFVNDSLRIVMSATKDPVIDFRKAFKKDFIPIEKRQSSWKRFKGTLGWNRNKKVYQ